MTFRDWQALAPAGAARELQRRVLALPPAQRRAAIATLPAEAALAEAFARADRSAPLGGVPCFLKDLFDVAGLPTLAGSKFLPEVRSPPHADSALVRMLRRAGAVLAGKTHLHEFAYGITGENPHYGDCEHPRFPGRTTGGSSSGSAAVVAAGIAPLAIGTDTGGSVRLPAAFCGLFGFRLTPGNPLIADAFPLAPSFDTAGWFTANAADMDTTIRALVGVTPYLRPPRGCYLELPGLDPEVASAFRAAAQELAPPADTDTAATLRNGFSRAPEAYATIVATEAWATHAPWADRFRERYDPVVRERLSRAQTLPRATYERALVDLTALRLLWARFFAAFDFLVLPASPSPALLKADCTLANRQRILALTSPASVGGLPALTLPVPLPSGLSTGLQFVVNHPQSLALGWALEQYRR